MTAEVLFGLCVLSPLVFAATVWLTRAGTRRTAAALAGCATAAIFSVGWDALAAQMGWWHYSSGVDLFANLTFSLTSAFLFGGTASLIGWRMMRSAEWVGGFTFIATFVGIGLLRDHALEVNTSLMAFGPGPMPQVMAAVGYLTMALAVQITMLLVAGPPRGDQMRADG